MRARLLGTGFVVGALLGAGAMRAADEDGCGRAVADEAAIPRKAADLFIAWADGSDAHADLLERDVGAEAATEIDGMRTVARSLRALAAQAAKTAGVMEGAAQWPDVPCDPQKLALDPKSEDARKRTIAVAKDLSSLLAVEAGTKEGQRRGGTTPR